MRRWLGALALACLPACGPWGISGDYDQAGFVTGSYCLSCRDLRGFAVGGTYRIGVNLRPEACPAEPWTVVSSRAPIDFTPSPEVDGAPACQGSVTLHADAVGPVRLNVRSDAGDAIDTIGLVIEEPTTLSIGYGGFQPWTPIDATRITIPQGHIVQLRSIAVGATAPLILDERLVSWEVPEGGAISRMSLTFGPEAEPPAIYAAEVGEGVVRAELGELSAELVVEVVPVGSVTLSDDLCLFSREICDGLDNDCDGEADGLEADLACAVPGTTGSCVEGRCELGPCFRGWADCEGADGVCESSLASAEHCGACGTACGAGETCTDGACAIP